MLIKVGLGPEGMNICVKIFCRFAKAKTTLCVSASTKRKQAAAGEKQKQTRKEGKATGAIYWRPILVDRPAQLIWISDIYLSTEKYKYNTYLIDHVAVHYPIFKEKMQAFGFSNWPPVDGPNVFCIFLLTNKYQKSKSVELGDQLKLAASRWRQLPFPPFSFASAFLLQQLAFSL
jgi:hypothetical protein